MAEKLTIYPNPRLQAHDDGRLGSSLGKKVEKLTQIGDKVADRFKTFVRLGWGDTEIATEESGKPAGETPLPPYSRDELRAFNYAQLADALCYQVQLVGTLSNQQQNQDYKEQSSMQNLLLLAIAETTTQHRLDLQKKQAGDKTVLLNEFPASPAMTILDKKYPQDTDIPDMQTLIGEKLSNDQLEYMVEVVGRIVNNLPSIKQNTSWGKFIIDFTHLVKTRRTNELAEIQALKKRPDLTTMSDRELQQNFAGQLDSEINAIATAQLPPSIILYLQEIYHRFEMIQNPNEPDKHISNLLPQALTDKTLPLEALSGQEIATLNQILNEIIYSDHPIIYPIPKSLDELYRHVSKESSKRTNESKNQSTQ
jgi:hypothetical protein